MSHEANTEHRVMITPEPAVIEREGKRERPATITETLYAMECVCIAKCVCFGMLVRECYLHMMACRCILQRTIHGRHRQTDRYREPVIGPIQRRIQSERWNGGAPARLPKGGGGVITLIFKCESTLYMPCANMRERAHEHIIRCRYLGIYL